MKKLIYTLPLILGLGACSSNDIDEPAPEKPSVTEKYESTYYFAFDVNMPTELSTRGTTNPTGNGSSDGEVDATLKENKLNSATIYLVDADYKVYAVFTTEGKQSYNTDIVESNDPSSSSTPHKVYVQANINQLVSIKQQNKDISMIMVGNEGTSGASGLTYPAITTETTADNFKGTTFSTEIGSGVLSAFATNTGNVMPLVSTSAVPLEAFNNITGASEDELKAKIRNLFVYQPTYKGTDSDIKGAVEGNTFNTYQLSIELERAVARVDYADRSTSARNGLGEFQYKVGTVIIELDNVCPFNVPGTSYLFRHTAAGTNEKANAVATLFGNENGGTSGSYNWVISHYWGFSDNAYTFKTGSTYQNPLISGTSRVVPTSGAVTLSSLKSNSSFYTANAATPGYIPCFYVAENTIPSISDMTTTNLEKYATGVAFTFKVMKDATNALTSEDLEANYPLGVSKSTTNNTTGAITITMPDGKWIDVVPSSDKCYRITYYGFLNHNNGSTSNGAGIESTDGLSAMQFGVVRNNAYQCSIAKIDNLPDPKNPKSLYLELNVTVKKWVKRTNNFEF